MTLTEVRRWTHSRFRPEHKTRRKTISAIVWGYLSVATLGVAAIARGISSSTAVRHSIKRVWRFLRNVNVDATSGMEVLCREAECLGRIMVVALDWVELRGGCRALVAGLCTKNGRALPLAWTVVNHQKFHRSQNSVEEGFLRLFSTFFVNPERVIIVADRGFRRAAFLAFMDALGFGYVVRICGHVHVKGKTYAGLLEKHPLPEGERFDLGRVHYREDEIIETRVVAKWMRGCEEPWYLATNLTKGVSALCGIYFERMEIEEGFRDLKSHRYGAKLRYVMLADAERYERLLMIWALGMWLHFGQGLAAVRLNLHLGLSSAPNTRRDLSIVRIGRETLTLPLGGPPALLRAMAA